MKADTSATMQTLREIDEKILEVEQKLAALQQHPQALTGSQLADTEHVLRQLRFQKYSMMLKKPR